MPRWVRSACVREGMLELTLSPGLANPNQHHSGLRTALLGIVSILINMCISILKRSTGPQVSPKAWRKISRFATFEFVIRSEAVLEREGIKIFHSTISQNRRDKDNWTHDRLIDYCNQLEARTILVKRTLINDAI